MNKQFEVFAKVNGTAHNPRYGRDCHAPAVSIGIFEGIDEYECRDKAEDQGLIYNPDQYQYEWVYSHSVELVWQKTPYILVI